MDRFVVLRVFLFSALESADSTEALNTASLVGTRMSPEPYMDHPSREVDNRPKRERGCFYRTRDRARASRSQGVRPVWPKDRESAPPAYGNRQSVIGTRCGARNKRVVKLSGRRGHWRRAATGGCCGVSRTRRDARLVG